MPSIKLTVTVLLLIERMFALIGTKVVLILGGIVRMSEGRLEEIGILVGLKLMGVAVIEEIEVGVKLKEDVFCPKMI